MTDGYLKRLTRKKKGRNKKDPKKASNSFILISSKIDTTQLIPNTVLL